MSVQIQTHMVFIIGLFIWVTGTSPASGIVHMVGYPTQDIGLVIPNPSLSWTWNPGHPPTCTWDLGYPPQPPATDMTSGGHHWRPVQVCSLEDIPPLLTPSGSHQNMHGWQVGNRHPTGMPSCF